MKTATVTEAKNGLSALLDRVKAGERVLITDRGVPIAVVEPYTTSDDIGTQLFALARAGLARLGEGEMPPTLLQPPTHRLPDGSTLLDAVREERSAGW
jgi:prevent-host-death family protein